MSEDNPVVGVRVSKSRRSELEEFAEENGYDTIQSLFRMAVTHEMSEDYGLLSRQQSEGADGQMGDLVATITRLRAEIEDMSEELDTLSEEVQRDRSSQIIEGMSAVHRVLPTNESEAMDYNEVASQFEDLSPEDAWDSLIQLYDETASVHRSSDGGWYKDP